MVSSGIILNLSSITRKNVLLAHQIFCCYSKWAMKRQTNFLQVALMTLILCWLSTNQAQYTSTITKLSHIWNRNLSYENYIYLVYLEFFITFCIVTDGRYIIWTIIEFPWFLREQNEMWPIKCFSWGHWRRIRRLVRLVILLRVSGLSERRSEDED